MHDLLDPVTHHGLLIAECLDTLPPFEEILLHALVNSRAHLRRQLALLEPIDDELRQLAGTQCLGFGRARQTPTAEIPRHVALVVPSVFRAELVDGVAQHGLCASAKFSA